MIDLKGKRILVTGASSGIGKAFSHKAASLGASLILWGRDENRLKEVCQALSGTGHHYDSFDLTDYKQAEQNIRQAVTDGGSINGFVHSAGIEKTIPFRASTPALFREIFEINVFAAYEIARILARKDVVDPAGASFVFISSVAGKTGDPGKVAYCSSKSALLAGSKAMALELSPKKIRCNCILPGIVKTPMADKLFETIPPETMEAIIKRHPLGIGEADDIANLLCFLISDQAGWITGAEYTIDGGYSA
jgi:NAD(P)-dependent dehydrogenase (short-subunit alcohol dehydrogenase family)